ncbi:unnamed protein product [Phytomonas sp. EM1]|nr:unnamed protein product [Phytomonas sp. EM1]|eukprot:CCW61704.1 unnamed protein product [Phytomonas sp. isolate EM1]
MLFRSLWYLKKKVPPLGYSKKTFFKKLNSPRASKPWRDRSATSAGCIEVDSSTDVHTEDGQIVLGNLTSSAPLGVRSPHLSPKAAAEGLRIGAQELFDTWSKAESRKQIPSPEGNCVTPASSSELVALNSSHNPAAVLPYGEDSGRTHALLADSVSPTRTSAAEVDGESTVSRLAFGNALNFEVKGVHTFPEGPVPIHLQPFKRSKKELMDSIVLPRHINKLFHKIMGWSEELVDIEADEDLEKQLKDPNMDPAPQLLRKKMVNLSEKMKYGVLLDAYEKDKFAIEHQLELAGNKMERKFLEWEGAHVLDQDASSEMEQVFTNKTSIVMDMPSTFHIPVLGRDCCPGCGALLQGENESVFGYVHKGEVERYVLERQRKVQTRHEYAARIAELQAHWEKHGRHVGEEWLDFMTQEEFNAFYRDRATPFVCNRCHALENLGVKGRRKVWSAPDFTEKLRALKEQRCVMVLVVDITDFPGSMIYDLPGLISMNNPVIIAANKMDCVRNRSFKYSGKDRAVASCLVSERYVQRWVLDIATQFGLPSHLVRDVVPVSAKRGWNVDKLITTIEEASNLNLRRPHKPLPTYFIGAANSGKSSLLNAIAHKLYVPQPPHPESRKVYYTKVDSRTGKEAVFWRWYTPPNVNQAEMLDIPARHDKKASKLLTVSSLPGTTVSINAVRISLTKPRAKRGDEANTPQAEQTFFYDTPGLLPHWHQHSPLTLLQMRRTLIRKFRNPQCFIILPGHTLFLAGLAAVSVMKGPVRGLLFMVYTSQKARHAIVNTDRADTFWEEQLGKALEPPGSLEQLASSSGGTLGLSESRDYLFECYNRHRRRPKADIYICGLGWTSFCVSEPADVVLRVRTLPGVIHGVREPLRYNDLRAFQHWPKLRRRFTSKSIEDLEDDVDKDSINTLVRLTAQTTNTTSSNFSDNGVASTAAGSLSGLAVQPVVKAFHPHHTAASSAPLDDLIEELQSSGKV